jgi:hypothetical protein
MKRKGFSLLLGVAMIFFVAAMPVFPQQAPRMQGAAGQRASALLARQANPLVRLRNALQKAGAPELTTGEMAQIRTLVMNFRTANNLNTPVGALQSARREFNNAILSGNLTAAADQAAAIVNGQRDNAIARMTAQAGFAAAIIDLLRENGQAEPLLNQIGGDGLVRLTMSLASGPLRERVR